MSSYKSRWKVSSSRTDWSDRDAFAGALLAGIVQNQDLEICVDMGHWLAHLVIQEIGAKYVFGLVHLQKYADC